MRLLGYDKTMAPKVAVSPEEYLRTSYPNPDREYRDGETVERAMPNLEHGTAQGNIYVRFKGVGKVHRMFPTVETRLRISRTRFLIPDVAVFHPGKPAQSVPDTPPLIVVEVLSPEDRMSQVLDKLEEYRQWGVKHVWLVDPHARRLYTFGEGLREVRSLAVPEAGLELTPGEIFD
jgi:Uma2 family endonuclease